MDGWGHVCGWLISRRGTLSVDWRVDYFIGRLFIVVVVFIPMGRRRVPHYRFRRSLVIKGFRLRNIRIWSFIKLISSVEYLLSILQICLLFVVLAPENHWITAIPSNIVRQYEI